jgi:transposase
MREVSMPWAYSGDLRERVLLACEEEGMGAVAAARRYRIGERTVYSWRQVAHQEG